MNVHINYNSRLGRYEAVHMIEDGENRYRPGPVVAKASRLDEIHSKLLALYPDCTVIVNEPVGGAGDVHRALASVMLKKSADMVTPAERKLAKELAFMSAYARDPVPETPAAMTLAVRMEAQDQEAIATVFEEIGRFLRGPDVEDVELMDGSYRIVTTHGPVFLSRIDDDEDIP